MGNCCKFFIRFRISKFFCRTHYKENHRKLPQILQGYLMRRSKDQVIQITLNLPEEEERKRDKGFDMMVEYKERPQASPVA